MYRNCLLAVFCIFSLLSFICLIRQVLFKLWSAEGHCSLCPFARAQGLSCSLLSYSHLGNLAPLGEYHGPVSFSAFRRLWGISSVKVDEFVRVCLFDAVILEQDFKVAIFGLFSNANMCMCMFWTIVTNWSINHRDSPWRLHRYNV